MEIWPQSETREMVKKEERYLGHVVSESGISTDPDKISASKTGNYSSSVNLSEQFEGIAIKSYNTI